jgi:cell division protein FtsI (penicillin-binding protein 3)
MLGRTDSRPRLLLLLVGLAVVAASLVMRLGYWQVVKRDELAAQARDQTSLTLQVPSRRGAIFDRSGTLVLAQTIESYRLAASPDQLGPGRRGEVAEALVRILDLDDDAARALTEKVTSDRPYVVLARDLDETVAERIRQASAAGALSGVTLDAEPVRVYPQAGGGPGSTLAAQLLGFVNREGVGQYGVEQYYQAVLAGTPRTISARRDTNADPIPDTTRVIDPGVPGVDLRLTIDAGLQQLVEQESLAAWVADHAVSVSALVMDPYTGEIYAYATYPSYDANDYRAIAADDPSRFIDPIVSEVYEPGSVFKMLTAVAGLEQRVVTPTTKINDTGTLRLDRGRTKVDDADRKAKGWMEFQDIIAYSRNVGAAKVALSLGKTTRQAAVRLHDTWTRLGIGQRTGVDLAGEVPGLVRDPTISTWREIDVANGSFGQGVAVTPLQLAVAYSAMVNGGTLVTPRVVKAIGGDELTPAARATGVIDPALTPTLIGLLEHVVSEVDFYRDRTLVPGYAVGGKTGTAQIWDPKARGGKGEWKRNLFNYTFVGYIGRGRPELIVAVRIQEARPTVVKVGQLQMPVMSFELFRRIATDAITTLDLPEPPTNAPVTAADGSATATGPPVTDR